MCVCHFPKFYIAFCGLFITNSSQSVDEITPKSQFFEKKFDMKIEIQFDAIQNEEFLLHLAVLNNSNFKAIKLLKCYNITKFECSISVNLTTKQNYLQIKDLFKSQLQLFKSWLLVSHSKRAVHFAP